MMSQGNNSGEWWFSSRPPEKSKEKFITYKYRRKYLAHFKGAHRRSRQKERQDLGHTPFLGSLSGVF